MTCLTIPTWVTDSVCLVFEGLNFDRLSIRKNYFLRRKSIMSRVFSDNGIYVNVVLLRCPGVFSLPFQLRFLSCNNRLDGHLVQLPVKQFIKAVQHNHTFPPVQFLIVPNG